MSIKRNSVYNLIGSLLPIAVTLFTVPIYLNVIGLERYGFLAIAWMLLGFFGFFDFGLGRATARLIANLSLEGPEKRSVACWTALALNAGLGLVGAFVLWGVAYWFFSHHFQVEEALRAEIVAAVPWLSLAVPSVTLSSVLSGSLQGREKFVSLNVAQVLNSVFSQVLPLLAALYLGPSLPLLIVTTMIGRLLYFLVLLWQCARFVPLRAFPVVDPGLVPQLFRYGGWVSATSIVSPLIVVFDQFVIGGSISSRAVAVYSVPFNLANRLTIVPSSLAAALFPRLAAESGETSSRLAHEALLALIVVITPSVIAGLILVGPFLRLWLGAGFVDASAVVGQIILIGVWANSLTSVPFTKLQARGRPDIVAKCALAQLVPYMALVSFAAVKWGVFGVAIVWTIRVIVDCAIMLAIAGLVRAATKYLFGACFFLFLAGGGVLLDGMVGVGVSCVVLVASVVWAISNRPASLANPKQALKSLFSG